MPAQYPSAIVTTTQLPTNRSDSTPTAANHINDHNNAALEIIAIETELGTSPSGSASTVSERISNIESTLSGNIKPAVRTVTSSPDFPSDTDDCALLVDSTGGPITVTLPATPLNRTRFEIKDKFGTAGTNNITVNCAGIETIDGASDYILNSPYESISLVCDGSNWYLI
jgi:hypothetical protein